MDQPQPESVQSSEVSKPVSGNQTSGIVIGVLVLVCMALGVTVFFLLNQVRDLNQRISSQVPVPTPMVLEIPTPTLSPAPSQTENPEITSTPTPEITLAYKLPVGWKKITDTSGKLELAYNPETTEVQSADKLITFSGKWITKDGKISRIGYSGTTSIIPYNGGSRHQALYQALGVTGDSQQWQFRTFSERQYSYSGWSCLFFNGVSISQFDTLWGICPVSATQGILFTLGTLSWNDFLIVFPTLKYTP